MHRLKAASAGSCNTDAFGIDLWTRQQVVEGAETIPNFPTCQVCACEICQIAEHCVLRADPVVAALACLRIPELAALPLTHGIPADDHIPALHQPLTKRLIMCLPVFCVAGRHQNSGMLFILAAVVVVGHVQKRRHIQARQAFEDQLFNVKAVHRNASRDARV